MSKFAAFFKDENSSPFSLYWVECETNDKESVEKACAEQIGGCPDEIMLVNMETRKIEDMWHPGEDEDE